MATTRASFERSALGRRFRFSEHGTTLARDTVAGATTFIVMSYIIFVNQAILGFSGVPDLEGKGLPFAGVLIDFHDDAVGLSAAIVIMIMPFTFSITHGIAAGFIFDVLIRLFQREWARIHPLLYTAAFGFVLYFLVPLLQQEFDWI